MTNLKAVIDFRELLDFFLDLCGAVCAVDVFHYIDGADRFRILWADLNDGAGLDLISNLLHLREQLCSHGRVDPELSCRESQNTVIDFRELLDLFLDLCGAVRAVDVFHHVDHTGGFRCRTVVVFGVLVMMIVFGAAAIVIVVMMVMSTAAVLVIIIVLMMVMVPTAAVLFMLVIIMLIVMMVSAVAVLFMLVIMLLVMVMVPTAAMLFVLVIIMLLVMVMVSAAANLFVLVVC